MTTIEIFKHLPIEDQEIVIIYFISGIIFILLSYVLIYFKFIRNMIRYSLSLFMFSIGFMFLSTGGKIMQGHNYNLLILTRWSVIVCTIIAIWVVFELLKWNKKKQQEKQIENETNISSTN